MNKKILITGATGLIGKRLVKALESRGDEVTIFTRSVEKGKSEAPSAARYVKWDYQKPEEWQFELSGMNAIVHLAGANIFGKRWNDNYKKIILESREISTRNLVKALSLVEQKPSVFVSASAVGYYSDKGEQEVTEDFPPGDDFLADVCTVWEKEAAKADNLGIRRVSIRTGVVLSTEEGALKEMLTPFKFFIGGPLGNGKQWFPWIHIDDIIKIYLFAIDNTGLSGGVNSAAPSPVRMEIFAKKLGDVLNRPSMFNVPKLALKIATGEVADVVTFSQKIIPQKLYDTGYEFLFADVENALKDLLNKSSD